jgi:hypothetical protein
MEDGAKSLAVRYSTQQEGLTHDDVAVFSFFATLQGRKCWTVCQCRRKILGTFHSVNKVQAVYQ